jgi:hypothetical protein
MFLNLRFLFNAKFQLPQNYNSSAKFPPFKKCLSSVFRSGAPCTVALVKGMVLAITVLILNTDDELSIHIFVFVTLS